MEKDKFTQAEIYGIILKSLAEIRLEQLRIRAYTEAFVSMSLSDDQKEAFKSLFKQKYKVHLQRFIEENPLLLDEFAQEIIDGLDNDTSSASM